MVLDTLLKMWKWVSSVCNKLWKKIKPYVINILLCIWFIIIAAGFLALLTAMFCFLPAEAWLILGWLSLISQQRNRIHSMGSQIDDERERRQQAESDTFAAQLDRNAAELRQRAAESSQRAAELRQRRAELENEMAQVSIREITGDMEMRQDELDA